MSSRFSVANPCLLQAEAKAHKLEDRIAKDHEKEKNMREKENARREKHKQKMQHMEEVATNEKNQLGQEIKRLEAA